MRGRAVVVRLQVREPCRAGRDARVEAQLLEVVVPVLPGEGPEVLAVEDQDVEGEQQRGRRGGGPADGKVGAGGGVDDDESQHAEVERLLAMGARRADIGQGEQPWVVLLDPEGNEFCILNARSG